MSEALTGSATSMSRRKLFLCLHARECRLLIRAHKGQAATAMFMGHSRAEHVSFVTLTLLRSTATWQPRDVESTKVACGQTAGAREHQDKMPQGIIAITLCPLRRVCYCVWTCKVRRNHRQIDLLACIWAFRRTKHRRQLGGHVSCCGSRKASTAA